MKELKERKEGRNERRKEGRKERKKEGKRSKMVLKTYNN